MMDESEDIAVINTPTGAYAARRRIILTTGDIVGRATKMAGQARQYRTRAKKPST